MRNFPLKSRTWSICTVSLITSALFFSKLFSPPQLSLTLIISILLLSISLLLFLILIFWNDLIVFSNNSILSNSFFSVTLIDTSTAFNPSYWDISICAIYDKINNIYWVDDDDDDSHNKYVTILWNLITYVNWNIQQENIYFLIFTFITKSCLSFNLFMFSLTAVVCGIRFSWISNYMNML